MTAIGINLAPAGYGSAENPFIDRFMTSMGQWGVQGGSVAQATLGANGYPVGMPSGASLMISMFAVDPANSGPTDLYQLTYSGTGNVFVGVGAQVVSSQPGLITFEYTGTNGQAAVFMSSDSSSDPVHDIHIVREDQVDAYQNGAIFNPDFIEKISQFQTLRTMDWQYTNDMRPVTWGDATTTNPITWGGPDGVPLDVIVKLANAAHTNLWYNVPTEADDTYVRNAMQYIKDHLDPSLKVQVEYSNEVWNLGFSVNHWAADKANAMWAVDSNHNGTIDSSEEVWAAAEVYYGYRAAQIASIAHDVFGAASASRLQMVLAGQLGNSDATGLQALSGIAHANVGSVSSLFSLYADTTYFGWQFGSFNQADQAKVLQWATSGAAGLTAAFQELKVGGALSDNASLAIVANYFATDAAFARQNGLQLVAYEGGADLEYKGFPSDQQATVKAFFEAMMNDPRMGDVYTQMINTYAAAGGVQLNAYADVGQATPFGYWGVLDNINQDSSPRYDALIAAAQANAGLSHSMQPLALVGTSASDTLVGGDGNDSITGSSSSVNASGAFIENDYYMGGAGADTIIGGQGNDHIYGNNLFSAAGAADGADSLFGGAGNDYIQGNAGNDTIDGGVGNDRLYGGADNDSLIGGAGMDYLQGNRGNDTLDGGADNDTLRGGADNDSLMGGAGNDVLYGDAGNDVLVGGTGHDTLTGGAGSDTFSFGAGDSTFTLTGVGAFIGDEITDFTHGTDKIALGFTVASLIETAPASPLTTVAAAEAYAQQMLNAHSGAGEVAAVQVGSDTYLFFNGAGTDGAAIDSVIKLDNVSMANVTIGDFI